jgi:hypothetical protein
MFVSSYTTYVDTNSVKRVQNDKQESSKSTKESFSSKLLQNTLGKPTQTKTEVAPNYISDYKALSTKQQLSQQEQAQSNVVGKFNKVNAQGNAQVAYTENSKMFSLLAKPKASLDMTPKIDKDLPKEALKNKESIMRTQMVNTYISNDNYYQITAA